MKYVICNGNKLLKYYISFSSVEEACSFLINETKCRSLHLCRIKSLHVSDCFAAILYVDYITKGMDFLIYGCPEYVEKETI